MKNKMVLIILGILLLLLACFLLIKLTNNNENEEIKNNTKEKTENSEIDKSEENNVTNNRIRFIFEDGKEVYATLEDNETAKSLLEQLPTTVTFEDFAGEEKIAYPKENLSQKNAPEGYDAKAGDICVYGPWGNLSIFYKDHGYSNGLLPVGSIDNDGIKEFEKYTDDFQVTIEKAEE